MAAWQVCQQIAQDFFPEAPWEAQSSNTVTAALMLLSANGWTPGTGKCCFTPIFVMAAPEASSH